MKRTIITFTVLVFALGTATCFAYPTVDRVTGGLKDIATSPLKITDNAKTEMDSATFKPFGLVGGATKGTFYMGKQMVDGVWTIVSTPYHMIVK